MKKILKIILPLIILLLLCIVAYVFASKTFIGMHQWKLSTATQQTPFMAVVAHDPEINIPDYENNVFAISEEVELICTADDGKLTLKDLTNNKTYEGTYKITDINPKGASYDIVIGETEGTATISGQRFFGAPLNFMISIDGYVLNFEVD